MSAGILQSLKTPDVHLLVVSSYYFHAIYRKETKVADSNISEDVKEDVNSNVEEPKRYLERIGSGPSLTKRYLERIGSDSSLVKRYLERLGSGSTLTKRYLERIGSSSGLTKRYLERLGSDSGLTRRGFSPRGRYLDTLGGGVLASREFHDQQVDEEPRINSRYYLDSIGNDGLKKRYLDSIGGGALSKRYQDSVSSDAMKRKNWKVFGGKHGLPRSVGDPRVVAYPNLENYLSKRYLERIGSGSALVRRGAAVKEDDELVRLAKMLDMKEASEA